MGEVEQLRSVKWTLIVVTTDRRIEKHGQDFDSLRDLLDELWEDELCPWEIVLDEEEDFDYTDDLDDEFDLVDEEQRPIKQPGHEE